jgi:D-threo-aldose 1-dehydrogenase
MMRSFEDSIQRLLLPSVDLAIIHDLDLPHHSPQWRLDAQIARLATDGWHAVEDLKRVGLIRAIGMGVNDQALIPRFLELFDVDFFLLAGRYTLMEQNSLAMLDLCYQRGVGIVVGAVLRRGLLLTGSTSETGRFAPRAEEVLKAGQLQAVCKRHGVPLPAAALQFPLGHPAITSVLVGALAPDHVRSNIESFSCPIPPELWLELKAEGLVAEDAPVPEH